MGTPIFEVNAFASEPFRGNPACVCLLDRSRSEEWMQAVAREMNLSETAFLESAQTGWKLRWFTPAVEVPLCGHATLASAHVLFETGRANPDSPIQFETRWSGGLRASRNDSRIELDFPAIEVAQTNDIPAEIQEAIPSRMTFVGVTPKRGENDFDYLCELENERQVRELKPRFARLKELPAGVIVTAKSERSDCEFVSRYFVGYFGIDEDPVTGVAHCSLVPYWIGKLNKPNVIGYQASRRGGYVHAHQAGDRVFLSGHALTIWKGELLV